MELIVLFEQTKTNPAPPTTQQYVVNEAGFVGKGGRFVVINCPGRLAAAIKSGAIDYTDKISFSLATKTSSTRLMKASVSF